MFDEDYLYFYEQFLTQERTEREVDVLWRVLDLEPGLSVLDLGCGHGRIANALAERRVHVTGLDSTPLFLSLARRDAAQRGVHVDYVEGDMRSLLWDERFDRIVSWFTSFGYFADEDNRRILAGACRALVDGGRLAIEMPNRDAVLRTYQDSSVVERDGDLMVDRHRFELESGRMHTERIVVRGGRLRRFHLFVRLFAPSELRDWLCTAGFADVDALGEDGEPLSLAHRRMILVATK